jgi:hypothetical protein
VLKMSRDSSTEEWGPYWLQRRQHIDKWKGQEWGPLWVAERPKWGIIPALSHSGEDGSSSLVGPCVVWEERFRKVNQGQHGPRWQDEVTVHHTRCSRRTCGEIVPQEMAEHCGGDARSRGNAAVLSCGTQAGRASMLEEMARWTSGHSGSGMERAVL